ncbi:MAG: uroporphyrinogen-III C-methyltransferase, partial [Burkholderiales bacterium]
MLGVVALVIALIALGLSGFAAFWSIERARDIEEAAARRLHAADRSSQDLSGQLQVAQDGLRELQGRTALMEAKLGEALTQQSQLDRILQDFSRNRSDRQLADVEQAVLTAARQLEWNGNVRGALLALQEADEMLERMNLPASIGLQRLIEADIERVRGLDTADVAVWIRRLDGMIGSVDRLRLVVDAVPAHA